MYSIAIVDDNEAWGFTLSLFLRQHNYSASAFDDPEAFLKRAQEFDLALVDFSIPSRRYQRDIDGPSLINKLKQQLKYPPLFILISAYFTEEILQYPVELCPDADACLSKSTGLNEILQCVEQLLANNEEFLRHRRSQRQGNVRELFRS